MRESYRNAVKFDVVAGERGTRVASSQTGNLDVLVLQ